MVLLLVSQGFSEHHGDSVRSPGSLLRVETRRHRALVLPGNNRSAEEGCT
jgi:hypothetical protein